MKQVAVPILNPGVCRICGASSAGTEDDVNARTYFLDMEFIEDFWGNVYYCNYCFDQMARAVGYVPADDEVMNRLKRELDLLRIENGEFVNLYQRLSDSGVDLHGLLDFLYSNPYEDPTEKRERAARRRKTRVDSGEKGTAEPDNVGGSVDVPKSTGNNESLISL